MEYIIASLPLVFCFLIFLLYICISPVDVFLAFVVSLFFKIHSRYQLLLIDTR